MIPLLLEQPIRTLGRDCTADLSDKQVVRLVEKQLAHSLSPSETELWCYQFKLFQHVMWPLKVFEIPSTMASRLDGIANKLSLFGAITILFCCCCF